jgi:hypothetical protein
MVYVHFVFVVVLSINLLHYAYRSFFKPEVTEDTHLNVPRWRSMVAVHTYLSMFMPCHYRCEILHTLQCLLVVDLIMLFLGALLKQLPTHSTPVYILLGLVTCVVASIIHIIFDRIIFSWKFDEDYIKRVERRRRRSTIASEMLRASSIWGDEGMKGEGGDYGGLNKGALDVLDNVRFDRKELSRPQGRSVQIDPRFSDGAPPQLRTASGGRAHSYMDDAEDDADLDVNNDLAFVGLYRPEEEVEPSSNKLPSTRLQRPRLTFTDPQMKTRGDDDEDHASPPAHLKTPPEHELYVDDDDDDDDRSYGAGVFGRNEFLDEDEESTEHQQEYDHNDEASHQPRNSRSANSAEYKDNDDDEDDDRFDRSYGGGNRSRINRDRADVREQKRSAARPVHQPVEELASSSSSDVNEGGGMDDEDNAMFLYGQLALDIDLPSREHRPKPATPAKTVSAESTLGNDEEMEEDVLSKAPPRFSTSLDHNPVSILNKYSKYAEATGGDDIDPFDTAAKELGDKPRVWTPIIAFNIRATSLSLICIAAVVYAQWKVLNSLEGISPDTCDSYPTFLYLTIGAHCFVFEPIVVALTYLHRVLNSDEYDDFFSELHPYTGDLRDSGPAS